LTNRSSSGTWLNRRRSLCTQSTSATPFLPTTSRRTRHLEEPCVAFCLWFPDIDARDVSKNLGWHSAYGYPTSTRRLEEPCVAFCLWFPDIDATSRKTIFGILHFPLVRKETIENISLVL